MGSKASNQKTKKIPEEKKKINIQASNLNEMRNFLSEENKIQKFHNQLIPIYEKNLLPQDLILKRDML